MEPFLGWSQAQLLRIGLPLVIVGGLLVLADRFRTAIGFDARSSALLALVAGMYVWWTLGRNPSTVDLFVQVSVALVVLLPAAICLRLFRELAVIK